MNHFGFPIQPESIQILDPILYHISCQINEPNPRVTLLMVVDDASAILLHSENVFPQINPESFAFNPNEITITLELELKKDVLDTVLDRLKRHYDPASLVLGGEDSSFSWPLHSLEAWELIAWEIVETTTT